MSESRPRVSAVLLSYNCAPFIRQALRSVLDQDCGPMEVVISDDASGDDTPAILQGELNRYVGGHQVSLHRRSTNSGSKSAHLNDAFRHVSGDVIVSFDGDDVSKPSRVRTLVDVFRRNPNAQAIHSAYALIDERGRFLRRGKPPHRPPGIRSDAWFARVDAYASGGTLALRRDVIDAFGPLVPEIHEDVLLPFRASLLGDVEYVEEELVEVRRHSEGLTQDYAGFASLERYRSRFLRGIDQARRQRDSRLADLQAAMVLMPRRIEALQSLREIISASMLAAETSAGLVSPSFRTRLATLIRLRRSGSYEEDVLRDLSLVFAPRAYLRYKRFTLRA